jgi:hypothetical protein
MIDTSFTVKNSLNFNSSIGFDLIFRVSRLDCSIFSVRFLCLYEALRHFAEHNFVTVVRAVNSLLQCSQIREILIFELI